MGVIDDPNILTSQEVEAIERLTTRWIYQALVDFGFEAYEVFSNSPDEVKDVAEDVTRDVLDRLQGFNIPQRVFGTVDYKKARYIILPDQAVRQALFVESKAEKDNLSATVQMSQISMTVLQARLGKHFAEHGLIPNVYVAGGLQFLTTTAFIHFRYKDQGAKHILEEVTVACIPNGKLQQAYNPTEGDTIWSAGRNAPTLGEEFRVRVSFDRLKAKARWRVQKVAYEATGSTLTASWED